MPSTQSHPVDAGAVRAAIHALAAERAEPLRLVRTPGQHLGTVASLLVALLLVFAGGVEAWRSARMRAAHGAWVRHTNEVLRELDVVESAVLAAESAQRGYLLTGDERFLQRGMAMPAVARGALGDAARLVRDNSSQEARLAELARVVDAKFAFVADVQSRMRRGDRATALARVRGFDGEQLTHQVQRLVGLARDDERRLLADRLDAESRAARGVQRSLALMGGGLLVAVVAGLLVLRHESARASRAYAAAAHSQARFRRVLETVRAPAVTLDAAGTITFVNDAACDLLGWSREELLGENWFARCVPGGLGLQELFARQVAGGDIARHFENEVLRRDGSTRLVAWDNTLLRDASGAVTGTASIGRDVTHDRQLMEALNNQALVDELTGLLNRRGFMQAAEREWMRARRDGLGVLVVALDLDRFKAINDTYGHHEGDAALQLVADVLRGTFRGADVVGRLGGDEFVAVVVPGGPHPGDADLEAMEQRVRERLAMHLDAANDAARAAGRPWEVRTSIGTVGVAAGHGAHRPATLAELLRAADARLYAAKERVEAAASAD